MQIRGESYNYKVDDIRYVGTYLLFMANSMIGLKSELAMASQ